MEQEHAAPQSDRQRLPDEQNVETQASAAREVYESPTLLELGKAVDLVQSYSSGKYSDGYTGYYWER